MHYKLLRDIPPQHTCLTHHFSGFILFSFLPNGRGSQSPLNIYFPERTLSFRIYFILFFTQWKGQPKSIKYLFF